MGLVSGSAAFDDGRLSLMLTPTQGSRRDDLGAGIFYGTIPLGTREGALFLWCAQRDTRRERKGLYRRENQHHGNGDEDVGDIPMNPAVH